MSKKKPKKILDESASEEEGGDQFTTVGKGGKAVQFTADAIFKTLQLVNEARGKKVDISPPFFFAVLSNTS